MVLKIYHHNKAVLNTGNTLKCGNTSYVGSYIRQATLVKQIVTPENGKSVDYDVEETELAPGVVYSLNKKARWNLPAKIRTAIICGQLEDEDLKISYLKKLKMHRRNTCIEYVANAGDVRHIKAKGHSYFNQRSIFGKKRRRKNPKRKYPLQPEYLPETREEKENEVPQVEYSIYIPSNKDSVMTYNRKYIGCLDNGLKTDDDASHIQSERSSKSGRSRKRVLKFEHEDDLLSDYDHDMDYDDVEEGNAILQSEKELKCDFSALLDTALWNKTKKKRNKKGARSKNPSGPSCWSKDHLIYKPDARPSEDIGERPLDLSSKPEMIPVTVQIDKASTESVNLEEMYRVRYKEAKVFPRKFVLEITDRVVEHFRKHPLILEKPAKLDLTSFLIIEEVEDEVGELSQHYKVSLNGNFNLESLALETLDDQSLYTVEEVIEAAVNYVQILPDESFRRKAEGPSFLSKASKYEIMSACPWDVYTLPPEEAFKKVQAETEQEDEVTQDAFSLTDLCNICYEDIGTCGYSAMALRICQHWFCNDCWKQHLVAQINNGVTEIPCPAHGCKSSVDDTTVLTLVSVPIYQRYHNFKRTVILQKDKWKWCPNETCGRAFKVVNKCKENEPAVVGCNCGKTYCELCYGPPHWPANCLQAKQYHKKLVTNRDDRFKELVDFTKVKDVSVNARACPECNNMVEKVDGCSHITCVCYTEFCWDCGQIYFPDVYHPDVCRNKPLQTIEIKHVKMGYEDAGKDGVTPLYRLAVQHHHAQISSGKTCKRPLRKHLMKIPRTYAEVKTGSSVFHARVLVQHQTEVELIIRRSLKLKTELNHLVEYAAIAMDMGTKTQNRHKATDLLHRLNFVAKRLDMLLDSDAISMKPIDAFERLKYFTSLGTDLGTTLVGQFSLKEEKS